jgi:ABC-type bacteriocin/lantibiotic exporter with double-glycine peptidase domain
MLSLKDKTIELILKSHYNNKLFYSYTIDFFIIFLKWIFFCNIINNIYFFIPYLIINIIETQNRRRFLFFYRDLLILDIKKNYFKEQLLKYDSLSLYDKKNNPLYDFEVKMKENFRTMKTNIEWGLSQFIKLLQQSFIILYICITNTLYISCVSLLLFNLLSYILFVKDKQDINNKRQLKICNENKNYRNMIKILLPMYENDSINFNKLFDLYLLQIKNNDVNKNNWRILHLLISNIRDSNLIMLLLSIQNLDIKNIFIMITLFSKISNTLADLVHFSDHYLSNQIEYNIYCNIFKNVVYTKKLENKKIPFEIVIESINININSNFSLKSLNSIKFKNNQKYLLIGKSGSGKTTFINALIGKIPGIKLNKNYPSNYLWDIIFHQQNNHIDTSNISIKELFKLYGNNKYDKELINNCCKICILNEWINYRDHNANIKNEYSGGQEKRLQIALNLYKLYINKNKLLILDEPESGSDPDIAYKMIDNILKNTPNTILIIISHLEKIKKKFIWDKILYIKNGIIH